MEPVWKKAKKYGTNINTFSISQHWNPLTLFDALADVRKEFNPVNLEDAFKTQEGQPIIIEAFNQWKIRVKNLSENLKYDSSHTR